jgi:6-phosphogluconate dehydrogenase
MTAEQFNKLNEEQKKVVIFEAKKITERFDEFMKYELFQIDNFFVETRTNVQKKLKRVIATFTRKEIPKIYAPFVAAL